MGSQCAEKNRRRKGREGTEGKEIRKRGMEEKKKRKLKEKLSRRNNNYSYL